MSRSFYLSLRLLPRPMRGAASLGYLLARASDTLADAPGILVEDRLECLSMFRRAVAEGGRAVWPERIVAAVEHPHERGLLERCDCLFSWLGRLPAREAVLVREVLEIITSGQMLDVRRFRDAARDCVAVLPDDAALDDYTWRVAGCVGEFWTKLGFLTIGPSFSRVAAVDLMAAGAAFGKGLQLVNILRDLPEDLRNGRCYLPVVNPGDPVELMAAHARWLEKADGLVEQGIYYARRMNSRRLRAACALPARLARETLGRMRGITLAGLEQRVKVPRRAVYRALAGAFLGFLPTGGGV